MRATDFVAELAKYESKDRAANAAWFFKTDKGGYGEGDQFLGATVPKTRVVCRLFRDLPLSEVQKLLDSPIHDHRLGAVLILVDQYKRAKNDPAKRDEIFNLYLKNVRSGRVNNWDIVDTSAPYIIGPYLEQTNRRLLFDLAKSDSLWQRRTALLGAAWYVRSGDPTATVALAELLLHDSHDLIQKAVGWQLREVGKRVDRQLLLDFLDRHAAAMPRTTLRYAIEHLSPQQKQYYMQRKAHIPAKS